MFKFNSVVNFIRWEKFFEKIFKWKINVFDHKITEDGVEVAKKILKQLISWSLKNCIFFAILILIKMGDGKKKKMWKVENLITETKIEEKKRKCHWSYY